MQEKVRKAYEALINHGTPIEMPNKADKSKFFIRRVGKDNYAVSSAPAKRPPIFGDKKMVERILSRFYPTDKN